MVTTKQMTEIREELYRLVAKVEKLEPGGSNSANVEYVLDDLISTLDEADEHISAILDGLED